MLEFVYQAIGMGSMPTQSELETINKLRRDIVVTFSIENHESILQEIFLNAILTETDSYCKSGPIWKSIGFQREDPVSDFRGGGILAAKNLSFFLQSYSEAARDMISRRRGREAGENYPWAAAGINITRILSIIFEVVTPNGLTINIVHSRKTYWKLLDEIDGFSRLYSCAFCILDSVYGELNASYMDFPRVLEVYKFWSAFYIK